MRERRRRFEHLRARKLAQENPNRALTTYLYFSFYHAIYQFLAHNLDSNLQYSESQDSPAATTAAL